MYRSARKAVAAEAEADGGDLEKQSGSIFPWAGCKQTVAGLSVHRRGSHRLRGPVALVRIEPMGAAVQRLEMSCWVDWVVIRMDQHDFVTRQVNERLRLGQGQAAETDGMRWPCAARDDSPHRMRKDVECSNEDRMQRPPRRDARTIRPDMMAGKTGTGGRADMQTERRAGLAYT